MKRKYISLVLAAILAFSSVSAYGAGKGSAAAVQNITENDDTVLTVDEAVTKAVAYSRTLKTLYESNTINELNADDTRTDLVWSSEYVEVTNLNVELKNLMNSIRNYDANVEIEKENIRLNIIELFAAIIKAEDSIDMYEKQIDLDERELKIAEVKKGLGLLSDTDYNAMVVDINKTKSSKQSLASAIDEAYSSLNTILGQQLNTKYTVSLDIDYEPLGDTDLEYAVLKAVSGSQSIKEKEEAAEIARYQLDVYSVEWSNDKKESKQNNYAQAERNLADAKTQLESGLRTLYNNIQTAETDYNNNLKSLEQMKKELEIKALQLKLGKITQLDYDKAEYEICELENTIKQSVYSHYLLVSKFNNPDLI